MKLHSIRRVLIVLCLLAGVSACAKPTPAPLPPAEIMARVVANMKALKGFSFVIARSGAPAYIDTGHTWSLSRVDGDYVSPDKATGNARIIGPGIVAAIKYISIGDQYWETNYLTGKWWGCPRAQCFNPAILFDPQNGIQPILESDLSDVQRLDNAQLEELPGKDLYSLTGKMKGERLYPVSWGMIGPNPVNVHLWVDPENFVVERIVMEDPGTDKPEPTVWTVDFLNFNNVVNIAPPPSTESMP